MADSHDGSGEIREFLSTRRAKITGTPAFILNGRLDILAANQLGFALLSPIYADPAGQPTVPGSSSSTPTRPSSSAT